MRGAALRGPKRDGRHDWDWASAMNTGLVLWLLMLSVLLRISAKDVADTFLNLRGGDDPPDHPLPAAGSVEKGRKRAKKPNEIDSAY